MKKLLLCLNNKKIILSLSTLLYIMFCLSVPALAQEEYTANASIFIFAEGLAEFPMIYVFVIILIAILIYSIKK